MSFQLELVCSKFINVGQVPAAADLSVRGAAKAAGGKRVLTRGAPDGGFHYPAGYRIGRIVKNVRPDSDYIKANTADIIFREGMNEAKNCIAEKGAIVLQERNIGKSRIDRKQTKA